MAKQRFQKRMQREIINNGISNSHSISMEFRMKQRMSVWAHKCVLVFCACKQRIRLPDVLFAYDHVLWRELRHAEGRTFSHSDIKWNGI